MRKATVLSLLIAMAAFAAGAQGLDGKQVHLKAGKGLGPVVVTFEGAAPNTAVDVVETGTGKTYPATARNGELVFWPEDATPGSEHTYTVKVGKETRPPKVEVKQVGNKSCLQVLVDGKLFTEYHYGINEPVTFDEAKRMLPETTEAMFKILDVNGDGKLDASDLEAIGQGKGIFSHPVTFAEAKAFYPTLKEERFKELDKNGNGAIDADEARPLNLREAVGSEIARYVDKKPYLWPVMAEGNVTITRNWPKGEVEGPTDHPHQKSLWTAHGVSGSDTWTETYAAAGYEQSKETTFGSGDAYGWIHANNVWQNKKHEPIVSEEREYRFYAGPAGARTFDTVVTFKADVGDVKFEDTKEGGIMALRMRPEIQASASTVRDINGESKKVGGKGTITNAEGKQGEAACWGKPSAWCDYSGPIEAVGGKVRGVTIMDNPSNLRFPAHWHVRGYGLMAANYFGLSDFEKAPKGKGEWVLEKGKSQTFKYRVLVHSGDVNEAKVADRYADYTTPPKAELAK